MFRLNQRSKKWHKKPKVDPTNPNGNWNDWWKFNTKNRDRPTGHSKSNFYRNWYSNGDRKYGRHQNRFLINEGLQDHADAQHDVWLEYFDEEYDHYSDNFIDQEYEDYLRDQQYDEDDFNYYDDIDDYWYMNEIDYD